MSRKTRVLVVDDSAFSRQTIKEMLLRSPGVESVETAVDGVDAIGKTTRFRPDIITLDLEMPGMDGFSFLRWIMAEQPTPVIVVSARSDSGTVFKALDLGAVDFIAKPSAMASLQLRMIEEDLLAKITGIDGSAPLKLNRNTGVRPMGRGKGVPPRGDGRGWFDIVAIGASTGGPQALKLILTSLPADFPVPIVVSQHMPEGFTSSFCERLNRISALEITEAEDRDALEPGKTLICPGGHHLRIEAGPERAYTVLRSARSSDRYVPSVDVMMESAAVVFEARTIGIVLTGMGKDGTRGMLEIFNRGGYTIAESEETAIVFGMPGEAIRAGAARNTLPLDEMPYELMRVVTTGKAGGVPSGNPPQRKGR